MQYIIYTRNSFIYATLKRFSFLTTALNSYISLVAKRLTKNCGKSAARRVEHCSGRNSTMSSQGRVPGGSPDFRPRDRPWVLVRAESTSALRIPAGYRRRRENGVARILHDNELVTTRTIISWHPVGRDFKVTLETGEMFSLFEKSTRDSR